MPGSGWRKSTYSGQDGNCVEACDGPGAVLLRDSRLGASSPVLAVPAAAWAAFTLSLR